MRLEIQAGNINLKIIRGYFPGGAVVKNLPADAGTRVRSLVQEDPTCRGATKPMSLETMLRNKRSHHDEKPVHHNEE